MKKFLLFTVVSLSSLTLSAQGILNSDFEEWETVAGSDEEPVNWNSFLTASGIWTSAASNQIEQSSDVRPGSPGTKSCRIWSTSTFNIIANGNVTLGRINMGSTVPTAAQNYNATVTSNPDFNQPLIEKPDSIVFWVKYVPAGSQTDKARMKATLHTDYNYRDPEDAASSAEVVAVAEENFVTAGDWERRSVAFDYSGPQTDNQYILVTFTTNEIGGGGAEGDVLFIDDVELIYNALGVDEMNNESMQVSMNNGKGVIGVYSKANLNGTYEVYNTVGQKVQTGELAQEIPFNAPSGMYFVNVLENGRNHTFQILKN